MKPEIAELWATELESGRWEQGEGYLKKGDKYCCLGVLCELAVRAGVTVNVTPGLGMPITFDGCVSTLPLSVQRWSGVKQCMVAFPGGDLAFLNDDGTSFAKIAQIIREDVDVL